MTDRIEHEDAPKAADNPVPQPIVLVCPTSDWFHSLVPGDLSRDLAAQVARQLRTYLDGDAIASAES